LCHPIDKIATYTWGRRLHAKTELEKRSSILLVPFGMVGVARLEGAVRCKLAHMYQVAKRQLVSTCASISSNPIPVSKGMSSL